MLAVDLSAGAVGQSIDDRLRRSGSDRRSGMPVSGFQRESQGVQLLSREATNAQRREVGDPPAIEGIVSILDALLQQSH